jgi:hypothetical protein
MYAPSLSWFKQSGKPSPLGAADSGRAGMCVGPTVLNRCEHGGGERKRNERTCGVKMHQLSNRMHWFKLQAMWRIGGKPLQHGDASAAHQRD